MPMNRKASKTKSRIREEKEEEKIKKKKKETNKANEIYSKLGFLSKDDFSKKPSE